MTVLTMIQSVAQRVGIPVPTTIIGNTDTAITQLLALANEEGEDLSSRGRWRDQVIDTTFTIVGTADQGKMKGTVAGDDYDYIINDTMWNRTTSLPIMGPLNAMEWETLQAFPVTGPYQQWIILKQNFFIDPTPTAGETMAFQYMSTSWCETAGSVGKSAWSTDNDTGLLNETLMALGLRWRWLKTKGLEYAQDFDTYEKRLLDALARDGGAMIQNLESRNRDYRQAGIVIPVGNWTVS